MDFTIRIAKKNILIHSVYSTIHGTCRDYLVDPDEHPDVEITITEDMLLQEAIRIKEREGEDNSLRTVEDLLVHRFIAESLLDYDILLMHGAVISTGKEAYMFTGKSGTGKTTHVMKWLENTEGSFVVNGDKPLILFNDVNAFACGTPWCGKEHYGTNTIVPLKSIIFMERSSENRMEAVSMKSILGSVLQQTYQPKDADKVKKTLTLLLKLKERVSFYKFYFDNYKDDCFKVAYDELTK